MTIPALSGLAQRVAAWDSTGLLWPGLLMAFAIYLVWLGVTALVRPGLANRFLGGFAQSWRVNLTEALLRGLVGLAFIGNSAANGGLLAAIFGLFLMVSAVGLVIFWRAHRRFAQQATSVIAGWIRGFGLVSMLFGAALFAMLWDQLVDFA